MSDEKRLKRGLNDVSPALFSAHEASAHAPAQHIPAMISSALLTPRAAGENMVRCMSILPFGSQEELLSHHLFVTKFRQLFGDLYLATIGQYSPSITRIQHPNVRQAFLSDAQIQEALHLQPVDRHEAGQNTERLGSMGIFIDPISMFEYEKNLLQILDYVILHVKTDSADSLVSAYQSFRACLEWNPSLHFLLLVDGKASEKISELVYEKFTRIASKFMSHEISFMGWMEGSDLRINEDLFLGGPETVSLWEPSKKILARMLRQDSLHHSL